MDPFLWRKLRSENVVPEFSLDPHAPFWTRPFFGVFFLFVPGMKSNNQGRMVTEVLGQPWLVVMSVVVLDGFSLANRGRPVKWLVGAAWRSAVWHVKGFPTATSSSTDFFFHEEPIRQDVRLYSEASVRVFAREMVRTSRVERWFWPCLFCFFFTLSDVEQCRRFTSWPTGGCSHTI